MARQLPGLPRPQDSLVDPYSSGQAPSGQWFRFFFDLLAAVRYGLPLTGTVTFDSDTTAAVTFAVPEATANYNVHVEAPEEQSWWITSKTVNGFTINVSTSSSASFGWSILRR